MYARHLMEKGLLIMVILAVLTGCATPTPSPTPAPTAVATDIPKPTPNQQATVSAIQTQAVMTFSSNLTQNAPTATLIVPTKTTAPTATAAVTNTAQKPAASPTATLKPQPVGPTSTTAVNCQITQVSPSSSDTLSTGAEFSARWVIVNTGVTTWTQSVFDVMYWSGSRFENQAKITMPFDVGQNSNITVVTGTMKAPSAPGTYKSVWAVVKGFQVYCLMPLTIVTK
jgi:hypothetical protein